MQRKGQTVFLLLILAQGAHSIEERITKLLLSGGYFPGVATAPREAQ